MKTLLDELQNSLQQDDRLLIDGKLAKNKVVELALKLDKDLLKLLLENKKLKERFFTDVDGTLVFDKHFFQRFVTNKQFLPDSYTAFKNKIGLSDNGEDYLKEKNDVTLIWPYKDCMLEGGQTKEDTKRTEIFWNETLAPDQIDRLRDPKVLTNFNRYDKNGESEIAKLTFNDNYLIKGNNLLTLHSLAKTYNGKVKLIYIDPPYNTGNDGFDYNDNFKHSTWLTFIKNRLEVAYDLLSNDGTIAISIDHNEIAYLLVLLDEIFGVENRRNIITIKRGSVTGAKVINPGVVNISEYVLIYSKTPDNWTPNRVYRKKYRDERYNKYVTNYDENYEDWKFASLLQTFADYKGIKKSKVKKEMGDDFEIEMEKFIRENSEKVIRFASLDESSISASAVKLKHKSQKFPNKVFKLEREDKRDYYIFNGELILFAKDRMSEIDGVESFAELISDIWDDVLPNDLHNEGGVQMRKGKKPEKLLSRIIELCTDEEDLVLDFFAGSGTTGSVCLKNNRNFILCEQLEYAQTLPLDRLINTINGEKSGVSKTYNWEGGGSFVYAELMEHNAEFVKQIEGADSKDKLQGIWEKMQESAFLSYKVNPSAINTEKSSFDELTLEEQKQFLVEVLDKNQLYVNYSEIEDEEFGVSEDDKKLNHQFYSLNKQ